MRIIFIYKNVVTGGCELLIERLSKELKKRLIKVCLVYHSIDDVMKNRFEKNNITLVKLMVWGRKEILSCVDEEDENYLITFSWGDFIKCNKNKKHMHTIFYSVHFQALIMGKSSLSQTILRCVAKKWIRLLGDNGQIICMDEQTIDYTKKIYAYNELQLPILRLAIDIVPEIKRETKSNGVKILSIARADFPFKGYLLGLIDWFITTEENVYLTIIAYGQDEKTLADKINRIGKEKKHRIIYVGKTDYESIDKYYNEADIFVGMGTTVLDASLRGVVSVPVKAYTYDLITDGFLYEDYRRLSLDTGDKNGFSNIVRFYAEMNSEEKNELAKRSRKIVVDNYSTHVVVDKLIYLLNKLEKNKTGLVMDIIYKYSDIKAKIKSPKLGRY